MSGRPIVVGCVDPRRQRFLTYLCNQVKAIHGQEPYRQSVAGAALGIAHAETDDAIFTLMEALLHGTPAIYLVQHSGGVVDRFGTKRDNGCAGVAYMYGDHTGGIDPHAEDERHRAILIAAREGLAVKLGGLSRGGVVRIIGLIDHHGPVEIIDLDNGATDGRGKLVRPWRLRRALAAMA